MEILFYLGIMCAVGLIAPVIYGYFIKNTDPVHSCKLYKDEGCAHVDGMLCNFDECRERKEYDLWLLEEQLGIPYQDRYNKTKRKNDK